MNPQQQREELFRFLDALPQRVADQISERNVDVAVLVHTIAAGQGLVLYETGNICEGVRRVLAGEDSAANLVSFIEKDQNIEEDNRPKIPQIAQEIQKQIFDVALPILKQAGMPIKEGGVAYQYTNDTNLRIDTNKREIPRPPRRTLPLGKGELATPPLPSPLKRGGGEGEEGVPSQFRVGGVPRQFSVPMDERHLRALLRIASGTTYTEDKLREAFEDLPEGLKRAIVSVDTANAVQEIAKKFLLHVDQMGALASETGLVLLGLTHPRDFVKNLASRLRISEQRALEIAREVSGQILVKVREALRTLHESPPISKSQFPISKQIPSSNIKTKTTTPSVPSLSSTGGSALGGEKEGRIRTPYSPEARWKTGAEDGNVQYPISNFQKEEKLTREEVLRGIENPSAVKLKTANRELETKVGPTGWRPPAPTSGNIKVRSSNSPSLEKEGRQKKDLLEQKLAGPVARKPETRRYTIDPYREPPE